MPDFFLLSCTSENINNLAHALMLKGAMTDAIFPVMDDLIQAISNMAKNNAHIPMRSLAHGQVKCRFLHLLNLFLVNRRK